VAVVNLTVYHVGPDNYTGIADMNSGDAAGDAFFMLRGVGLPWFCTPFDCQNAEEFGHRLVVTEFVVEARHGFSTFAECDIGGDDNSGSNPWAYSCSCRDRSRGKDYSHWPKVPCNTTVGRIRVLDEDTMVSSGRAGRSRRRRCVRLPVL